MNPASHIHATPTFKTSSWPLSRSLRAIAVASCSYGQGELLRARFRWRAAALLLSPTWDLVIFEQHYDVYIILQSMSRLQLATRQSWQRNVATTCWKASSCASLFKLLQVTLPLSPTETATTMLSSPLLEPKCSSGLQRTKTRPAIHLVQCNTLLNASKTSCLQIPCYVATVISVSHAALGLRELDNPAR